LSITYIDGRRNSKDVLCELSPCYAKSSVEARGRAALDADICISTSYRGGIGDGTPLSVNVVPVEVKMVEHSTMNEFEAMARSRRGARPGRREADEEHERRRKRKRRSQEHQNKGGEGPKDDPDKQKNGESRINPFKFPSTHLPKSVFGARQYLERVLKKEQRKRNLTYE
jgi:hypothetical protein